MVKDARTWLDEINATESKRGRLKIFLGYAAGVGKTYRMLEEGHALLETGVDIVIGYVETHQRIETEALLMGFEIIDGIKHQYRETEIHELSVKNIIKRHPDMVIIDELAHTNSSSWNRKRYQDIEEILSSGISVYTTVNVQHFASLHELIKLITNVNVKETVPDSFIAQADNLELIDIEPSVLLNRLKAGKIYRQPQAQLAAQNFFKLPHLTQLREIALQQVTRQVSQDNSKQGQQTRHFLVAISESPNAINAIHWAYRQAQAFDALWTAVYVNTRQNYLPTDTLKANLKLVQELGGEVAILTGTSVSEALIQYMQEIKISNLVIGKHTNQRWLGFLQQNIEDKIMAAIPFVDIQIIPGIRQSSSWKSRWLPVKIRFKEVQLSDFTRAIGLLLLATGINLMLHHYLAENSVKIMVYFIAVVLISRFTKGYIAGVISSVTSVFLFDYLFVQPIFSFKIAQSYYILVLIMMVITTIIISSLTSKLTKQMKSSVKEAKRSAILSDLSTTLISMNEPKVMSQKVANILRDYFDTPVQIFYNRTHSVVSHYAQNLEFNLDENNHEIIQWVWHHNQPAGNGTETLSGKKLFYLPITFKQRPLAVLVVNGRKFDYRQRLELGIFLFPLALALDNYYLAQEKRKIAVDNANNQLKSDLLRSISHDLRTPLTSIMASTDHLLMRDNLTVDDQVLLKNINKESNWLIQMIENILTITKISQGKVKLDYTSEVIEDVIFAATEKFKWINPAFEANFKIPDELIWLDVDNNLFQQVLINLFDNAQKHGDANEAINILIRNQATMVEIVIQNIGQQFSKQQIQQLGNRKSELNTKQTDQKRGLGIGLFLCQTIINLHRGKLIFSNWSSGPQVTIILPKKEL